MTFDEKIDDIARGFMLGLIAGVTIGILTLIYMFFTGEWFVFRRLLPGALTLCISSGIIGAIVGVLYAVLFDKLPGKTAIIKAVFLVVSPVLVIKLFSFVLIMAVPLLAEEVETSFNLLIMNFIFDILFAVFYGLLLGTLWESNIQKLSRNEFCEDEIIDLSD
ncbi:MAG: hypothetical protein CVT90_00615 [Candidatus Altiarchaeales archaeon HGW-Altiarchaeales-3]|nr:MAG: hypothetical protein CVT90_00615 [Candidatus Altiarchaeales archaeon HGW-Altiarchaeales-3]